MRVRDALHAARDGGDRADPRELGRVVELLVVHQLMGAWHGPEPERHGSPTLPHLSPAPPVRVLSMRLLRVRRDAVGHSGRVLGPLLALTSVRRNLLPSFAPRPLSARCRRSGVSVVVGSVVLTRQALLAASSPI